MTRVYFVRHAEPNYHNHDDRNRELTPKGLKDREEVTSYLADKEVAAIFSSPYKRSYDTVAHFARTYHLPIQVVEDFRERKIDSRWIEDFQSFAQKQWQDFDYRLAGGESLNQVQARNIKALNQVLQAHAGKNIVVATHGTTLATIIDYYTGAGYQGFDRIRAQMPYVLCLIFDGGKYIGMEDWRGEI